MQTLVLPLLPLLLLIGLMRPEKHFYQEWDFWVSMFTFLLASATLWVAFETRKMRKGSDRAMEEMAMHAAASAEAAKASAVAMRDLVQIGERPWVGVEFVRVAFELNLEQRRLAIATCLKNSGKTPAQGILVRVDYAVAPDEFPDAANYQHVANEIPVSYSLAPGTERRVLTSRTLYSDEINPLVSQKSKLFIYGKAEYSDVFGNKHRTLWCMEYQGGTGQETRVFAATKHNVME